MAPLLLRVSAYLRRWAGKKYPNEVQVVPQISLELLDGLPIHARSTLVRRNPLVRLPDISLGISNGLSCDFGMFSFASSQGNRPG
jgi:hypothetical protein